ncbi:unnamed protein product [[Actinomadura] parvosata subsp. kistnae]|nr:unnamed protein product [Actinomadura parvosata subsp. kistnae]
MLEFQPLQRYLLWMGADGHTAIDVTQAAFLLAFEHWHNIERPRPWLRKVASREYLRARRAAAEIPMDLSGGSPSPVQAVVPGPAFLTEQTHTVLTLLAILPLRQQAVMACYWDGYSIAEISHRLSLTPNNVRVSLHHARKKLSSVLIAGGHPAEPGAPW